MEEYLVSEVERFEELLPSIIKEVHQETDSLRGAGERQRRTRDILHQRLAQFIEGIPSPEPVLTALKWRFWEELEQELQFKENLDSFWRGEEPLNRACLSIEKKYQRILERLRAPKENPLELLPAGSWFLSLQIRLKKPYLGKDDGEVHVQDNPICRDKVFQLPFIRPTTWKGNLRSTAWLIGKDEEVIIRLFGNSRGEEKGQAGRLYFYTSFFARASIDLITPLDRQKKTPKRGPLYLECIPSGEIGIFSLLYLAGCPKPEKQEKEAQKVQEDLQTSWEILQAMLFEYGFSAKKAEGYGIADEYLKGKKKKKDPLGMFNFNQRKVGEPGVVKTISEEFDSIQELDTLINSFAERLKGE